MKRPFHIWLCYSIGLIAVLVAMNWLTMKAMELDRAGREARQRAERSRVLAERQDKISSALWRMDWILTPLIAQEAARPYFVYQPFYRIAPGSDSSSQQRESQPSPLLLRLSEYVLVHFQLGPDGEWTCPQMPTTAEQQEQALLIGCSMRDFQVSRQRLAQLQESADHSLLVDLLPRELLPEIELAAGLASRPRDSDGASQVDSGTIPGLSATGQSNYFRPNWIPPSSLPGGDVGGSRSSGNRPRVDADLDIRNQAFNTAAAQQRVQQITWSNRQLGLTEQSIREGVSRPLWLGEKLLLARRVLINGRVYVQGCWLDWPKIKQVLLAEIGNTLPEGDLVPVMGESSPESGALLVTLPVQLVVPEVGAPIGSDSASAIVPALTAAWLCLLIGAVAVAVLLHGVMKLSERRAAFVSAVTHELRTPLTTFRMYAEMLAEGMVRDREQRREYAETMKVEADRLGLLVDNVLQYARLERQRGDRHLQQLTVTELLDRMAARLRDRAAQAEMECLVSVDDSAAGESLRTDPAAVEQILFNLVDNACKYASEASDRRIELEVLLESRQVLFRVRDHGPGIPARQRARLFRPFSKADRQSSDLLPGVGLGLSLCRRLAHELGGTLAIEESSDGAQFALRLPRCP